MGWIDLIIYIVYRTLAIASALSENVDMSVHSSILLHATFIDPVLVIKTHVQHVKQSCIACTQQKHDTLLVQSFAGGKYT